MNLLAMAWRNLGRKRARTALSLLAVAAGVWVVILTKALVDGTIETLLLNTVRFSSGHVRVIDREYQVKERVLSLQYPVDGLEGEGWQGLARRLGQAAHVAYVVPRLRFGAMAGQGEELQEVMAMGVQPAAEERLVHFSRYLAAGRFLRSGEHGAVLGRRLLRKLDLQVGDKFTLVCSTTSGSLRGATLTVVGELASGLTAIDDKSVFLPLGVAQELTQMEGAVTELLVMAREEKQVPRMLVAIRRFLAESAAGKRYLAIPWYAHNELMQYLRIASAAYNLIYLLILGLASFVIINTMTMIIHERRREIGMLSALGLGPGAITRLFLYEGALTGILGSVVGTMAGAALVKVLSLTGIVFAGLEAETELLLPPRIYPVFNLEVLGFAFLAGIAVSTFAVYWPARGAARLEPMEALRT